MDSVVQRFCSTDVVEDRRRFGEFHFLDPRRPVSRAEQLHRFGMASYALYWQTERIRERAISWRNFCVGCGIWAFRTDASTCEDVWQHFYGMNTKVLEGSRNICAEPIAMNAALSRSCSEIIGMIVVGNPREEDTTKTLRPCEHCRLLMKNHPLITGETVVICALPPKGDPDNWDTIPHEIFTFDELLKAYGER